jgi:cystathionine beta-lyase
VGLAYTRAELEKMSEICLRHNIMIVSDEIHSELLFDHRQHIPMPAISPEVAQKTIIVTAASKAFNLPGIALGITISKNHELLEQVQAYFRGLGLGNVNIMSSTAVQAAYQHGQTWLDALVSYLQANRDYAVSYIQQHMPGIVPTVPEATILMLLDCRDLGLNEEPFDFFLREARVALSGNFGSQGYAGFARLNFGCPRAQLKEALDRMRKALG